MGGEWEKIGVFPSDGRYVKEVLRFGMSPLLEEEAGHHYL